MPDKEPEKVSVSSLPFYGEVARPSYAARPVEESVLRDGFRVAREGVTEVVGVAKDTRDAVNHVVDTGKAHSSAAYFQVGLSNLKPMVTLRQPKNKTSFLAKRRREPPGQTSHNIRDWPPGSPGRKTQRRLVQEGSLHRAWGGGRDRPVLP